MLQRYNNLKDKSSKNKKTFQHTFQQPTTIKEQLQWNIRILQNDTLGILSKLKNNPWTNNTTKIEFLLTINKSNR